MYRYTNDDSYFVSTYTHVYNNSFNYTNGRNVCSLLQV